jgi:F-type H+-transporting ATPase subunit alpha
VHGLLEKVPMDKVAEFEKQYLQLLHAKHADDVLAVIASGKLTDDVTAKLEAAAAEVSARFNK